MKYEIDDKVILSNSEIVTISDAYESPSSGEIIYQVRLDTHEFHLMYEDDIPIQED